MFGFSFSEVVLIGVVTLVAVGPQRLPGMLKNLATWIKKLRKMTTDVRQQTGIDDLLRQEGLSGGLNELRTIMRGGGGAAPAPAQYRPAEDPYNFMPSPGRITLWHPPGGPGVRVDSHVYNNYFVPSNYDSMIGKIIVHADTREMALARMRSALGEMVVEGIKTNIPLHRDLLVDAKFMAGGTNIHYLEEWLAHHKR